MAGIHSSKDPERDAGMDMTLVKALAMIAALPVWAGSDRMSGGTPTSVDFAGVRVEGRVLDHALRAAPSLHRQQASPSAALLGDIDDDDRDDDSPTAATFPAVLSESGLDRGRVEALPGSGQILHVATERIPLRC